MISVIFLLAAVVVLWFINDGGVNREGGGETIAITESGETIADMDMDYIKSLESATFKAAIRSSANKPEDVEYTGVPLKSLLEGKGIALDGKTQIVVKGIDGYMASLSMDEFEKKDIYIAYEMDGKPMKPKGQNGYGPFQLVIPGDSFSQRWCKFVCEVEIK